MNQTYQIQLKHTLATFLSKELRYRKNDVIEALNKFEDEQNGITQ